MNMFLGLIGFVGFWGFLIALVIRAIKKKSFKTMAIGMIASVVIFVTGIAIDPSPDNTTMNVQDSVEKDAPKTEIVSKESEPDVKEKDGYSTAAETTTKSTNSNEDNAIRNEFYNKGYLISLNVFLRVNAMAVSDDKSDPVKLRDEIEQFEVAMRSLKTNMYTKKAEKQLENIFDIAYNALNLYEKTLNEDKSVSSAELWNKKNEAQDKYLEFGKMMDDNGIKLNKETTKSVAEILNEFTK